MLTQEEFLKVMVDLKEVEANLKCALFQDCPLDRVELATKYLHEITKQVEVKFWELIEAKR